MPDFYSYSQFTSFEMCRLQYKFAYIDRIQIEVPNEILEKGLIAHEYMHMRGLKVPHEEVINRLKTKYKENFISEVTADLQDITDDFFKNAINYEMRIDLSISNHANNYIIVGYIDRLDKIGNEYKIIDYKYGNYEYDDEKFITSFQPQIYALAIMRKYNLQYVDFSFYNLKQRTEVNKRFNLETIETNRMLNIIEKIEEAKRENNFFPVLGKHCQYCKFNSICDFYKIYTIDTKSDTE